MPAHSSFYTVNVKTSKQGSGFWARLISTEVTDGRLMFIPVVLHDVWSRRTTLCCLRTSLTKIGTCSASIHVGLCRVLPPTSCTAGRHTHTQTHTHHFNDLFQTNLRLARDPFSFTICSQPMHHLVTCQNVSYLLDAMPPSLPLYLVPLSHCTYPWGMARLSWPGGWLCTKTTYTKTDALSISALTRVVKEQLCCSRTLPLRQVVTWKT